MNSQSANMLRDGESSKKKGTRKAQQQQSRFKSLREDELQGPPSRTRASLKRRHIEPSSTKNQVENKQNQQDTRSRNADKEHEIEPKENTGTAASLEEPLGAPSVIQSLPDKQTLELIIDTLQRKDIYEIFAEPVDPEEVEDYYEIIEEPMDFGTMRAKLHEGLYTSLEQFEHDVFLISGNAMHFNSSGTIFFRQAHGIHKLAKRVFHVLRTNPENFESEFSGSRRKSCRRSQDETNELNCKSNLKTSEKRGGREGKRCDSVEVDRRSTYKPNLDLNNQNWSKSLINLNQQEHSYSQSLMQFVKDLGPTAQMVAKRKLQNLCKDHQTSNRDLGKIPQMPYGQKPINSYRSIMNDGIGSNVGQNRINPDIDLRLLKGGNCDSGGNVESRLASTSMPAWLQQRPCASRFALDLGFLKSKMGKMNGGRELEEIRCSSYQQIDSKDLTLEL